MKSPIPYIKNYELRAGDDFSEVLTFTGSTITSWTFAGNAVAADGTTTTALTFTKASPSVTVSIAAATTADFTEQPYKFNITITIGSVKKTYIEGVINVRT
jgi:hypothetical protein